MWFHGMKAKREWIRCVVGAVILLGVLTPPNQVIAETINNTATVTYQLNGGPHVIDSNKTTVTLFPSPTPATIETFRYAPEQNTTLPVDGGLYRNPQTVFTPLPSPVSLAKEVIQPESVPVVPATVYHVDEPVFIRLHDGNRNADPLTREFIEVVITTPEGDREILKLQETDVNTGFFAGVIQADGDTASKTPFNGKLFLPLQSQFKVDYEDPDYPEDTAKAEGLVDPFGTVFDSLSGQPVNGAIVSIVHADTGQPATVLGDDGVSAYPSTVVSGSGSVGTFKPDLSAEDNRSKVFNAPGLPPVTDSSGKIYAFPPGGFRFPFIAPGDYRMAITPPPGYVAPSAFPRAKLQNIRDAQGVFYAVDTGSFGDRFKLNPGRPLKIDIPIDPIATPFRITKSVSKQEASAGDFLQYRLTVEHTQTSATTTQIVITDRLPVGMRYQRGSLYQDGAPRPDPDQSADGRTLNFFTLNIPPGKKVLLTYVVLVDSGAQPGPAVNSAVARIGNIVVSNSGEATVRIREPFHQGHFTIIGRVTEGDCATSSRGVPNVRILMEDGTSAVTDGDGQYHLQVVRPGTHVVQMDMDTLPSPLMPIACIENSRFAGRAFSQFVDAQGGSLWRADFHLGPKAPERHGFIGIQLEGTVTPEVHKEEPPKPTQVFTFHATFKTLRAELSPDSHQTLEALVAQIQKMEHHRIEVVGHTDIRKIHGRGLRHFKNNYTLSQARAQSVVDYLSRALQLQPHQIKAIGRGADEPVATNKTRAGMAQNRRVEVKIYADEAKQPKKPVGAGKHFRYRINVDGLVPVENVQVITTLPPGVVYVTGSSRREGIVALPDPEIDGSTVVHTLGNMGANFKNDIAFSAWLSGTLPTGLKGPDPSCPEEGFIATTQAYFDLSPGQNVSTPPVTNRLLCPTPGDAGSLAPTSLTETTGRETTPVVLGALLIPSEYDLHLQKRKGLSDVEAAGGDRSWLANQEPGVAWLFPGWDHNPRSPTIRIVIKHGPKQKALLTHQDSPVGPVYFDQIEVNETVAVSIWQGIPLVEGQNLFRARIEEENGALADTLTRLVHYANQPARAVLAPEASLLIADGIQKPVIAVRLLDRYNKPVRAGVTGTYSVNSPYLPAVTVDETQRRQLAGMDRFRPMFVVEGDDGIAYIELAPTTETGAVVLTLSMQEGKREWEEPLRVWLEPRLRDWVVVGLAQGDVGYNQIYGNMESVDPKDREEGVTSDGKASLYAKGRILGKWLLTLAYNSDKQKEKRERQGLFSGIDPDLYYTLYGDATETRYDATSQENLYLKLSRQQFYILFGDYDTGMTETQLTRYNRSLTGIKTAYYGEWLDWMAYGAETGLHYVKNEIQGNGTSGLYVLSSPNIAINSEKIRVETRDRLKSERVTQTRHLVRQLDYDIDYIAGTLFFREPIPSRDTDFNPIFIVAEYETIGAVGEAQNAGGRVGFHLMGNTLTLGASHIREEGDAGITDVNGLDMKLKLGADSVLRLEGAQSEGDVRTTFSTQAQEGEAFLAEWEHHQLEWDTLVYLRRQEAGFGVGQQNGSESDTEKGGVEGRFHLTDTIALQGQVYRQTNLASQANREVGRMQLERRNDVGSVYAGAQFAADRFKVVGGDQVFRSEQAVAGLNYFILDKKLEIQASGEFALNGDNNKESLDFPLHALLGVNYQLTESVRLMVAQEVADGAEYRTITTRAGFTAIPWQGARLTSTLNQSEMEYGPRTFGQFGLTQAFLVGERWGFDLSADSNRTLKESGTPPPRVFLNVPIAAGGLDTDRFKSQDFFALSGGATYRAERWSWNVRAENRAGESDDRYGLTTNFLRQATAGVAFGLSAQVFQVEQSTRTKARDQSLSLSWAYRPLDSRLAVLDRMEFHYDQVRRQVGDIPTVSFGVPTFPVASDAISRRWINHITLNRVSRAWTPKDRQGNLFTRYQRNQWSLYYGAKYILDRINEKDYRGYTDMTGIEWRYDLTPRVDVGMRVSDIHAWSANNDEVSWGPMMGLSPFENGWITVGYNVTGFYDRDFKDAGYTREGPYLRLRIKFDQSTGSSTK
jgi:uncharacterized repeat protein (TIGR01451 family)